MQRVKTLINVIMESKDPKSRELNIYVGMCCKADRPNTRAKVNGQPLAITTLNRDAFLNRFFPSTTHYLIEILYRFQYH